MFCYLLVDINTVHMCYKMLILHFTQKFFICTTERQKPVTSFGAPLNILCTSPLPVCAVCLVYQELREIPQTCLEMRQVDMPRISFRGEVP